MLLIKEASSTIKRVSTMPLVAFFLFRTSPSLRLPFCSFFQITYPPLRVLLLLRMFSQPSSFCSAPFSLSVRPTVTGALGAFTSLLRAPLHTFCRPDLLSDSSPFQPSSFHRAPGAPPRRASCSVPLINSPIHPLLAKKGYAV